MLSKEDILAHIQQGKPEPGWKILRPKLSYFLGQVATWLILFLLAVGLIIYYLNTPDHALVLRAISIDTDNALQTWRTIDFVLFGLLAILFLTMLVVQVMDLLSRGRQLLVLTPQACLIRLRNKDYFVAYANVINIVPNIRSGRNISLHFGTNKGQISVALDNRFGKAKTLVSQIIAAHRQAVAAMKA